MKIVLASTSELKLKACKKAFARFSGVTIFPVSACSGVSEQPMNEETLTGAFSRISDAKKLVSEADLYISIESGLFEEGCAYIDRAVIAIARQNESPKIVLSSGVEFPKACVEEAKRRGLDRWTVGKIMQEKGIVKYHFDPHLDLSGKSRVEYIDDALKQALRSFMP